jgi:hypothetical protein
MDVQKLIAEEIKYVSELQMNAGETIYSKQQMYYSNRLITVPSNVTEQRTS